MLKTIPIQTSARADDPEVDRSRGDGTHEIRPDVAYQRVAIVNVVFVGARNAGDRGWVLIDAGIPGSAAMIASAAARRYGQTSRPAAIILTHGHFDHVGALKTLSERWETPIYAHILEHPYLDGTSSYPAPDPSVGGGLMAWLSPLYPRGPINVAGRLRAMGLHGEVPFMPGWRWLFTPGHTPGHISFWRESDRTLIAGDAFVTTAQESAYAVATQTPALHGPPAYYTQDWQKSRESVRTLAALEPEVAVTGHGRAMRGPQMRRALHTLANNFDAVATPGQGRYVERPAKVTSGGAYVTP
ncbi:MAG: MBL fold metallo-hydrolase [Gemmataceae bacterium]